MCFRPGAASNSDPRIPRDTCDRDPGVVRRVLEARLREPEDGPVLTSVLTGRPCSTTRHEEAASAARPDGPRRGLTDLAEGLVQDLSPTTFDPDAVLRDVGLEPVDVGSLRLREGEQRRLSLVPLMIGRECFADRLDKGLSAHGFALAVGMPRVCERPPRRSAAAGSYVGGPSPPSAADGVVPVPGCVLESASLASTAIGEPGGSK